MQRLTKEQAIIVSAYTGFLCCNFSDMHKAVEEKLNRPVFNIEFASNEDEVREAFKEDFLSICAEGAVIK